MNKLINLLIQSISLSEINNNKNQLGLFGYIYNVINLIKATEQNQFSSGNNIILVGRKR